MSLEKPNNWVVKSNEINYESINKVSQEQQKIDTAELFSNFWEKLWFWKEWKITYKPITNEEFETIKKDYNIPDYLTFESLNKYLGQLTSVMREKYWIEEWSIINMTRDDIMELKNNLMKSNDQVNIVARFMYDEVIETKLKGEDVSKEELTKKDIIKDVVTFKNIKSWIESERLDYVELEVDKFLQEKFKDYDFLWDRYEFIKLALINKVSNSPTASKIRSYYQWFTKTLENPKSILDNIWKVDSAAIKEWEEIWNDIESIMKPYIDWFKEIKTKLDSHEVKPNLKLNHEQKKNIINNMEYFNDLKQIEKWFNQVEILSKLDFNMKDKVKVWELTPENVEKLKKDILDIRKSIESNMNIEDLWNKASELALSLSGKSWSIKSMIEFMLKIPFLWKILAIFLWLDPSDPIADFESQIWTFKSLNVIKSFWATKTKDWKLIPNTIDWPLKDIDLSEIKHKDVKKELKGLLKLKLADKKEDEFFKEAFSDAWVSVKVNEKWENIDRKLFLKITEEQIKDWKVDSKELKEIINTWLKFEDDKNQKEQVATTEANKKTFDENEKKIWELKWEIEKTEWENLDIDLVLKFIDDKNNNDLKDKINDDIKVEDLFKEKDQEYLYVLAKTQWLNINDRKILKWLFNSIKNIIWENSDSYSGTKLNDLLKTDWWFKLWIVAKKEEKLAKIDKYKTEIWKLPPGQSSSQIENSADQMIEKTTQTQDAQPTIPSTEQTVKQKTAVSESTNPLFNSDGTMIAH